MNDVQPVSRHISKRLRVGPVTLEACEPRLLLAVLPTVSIEATTPDASENGQASAVIISLDAPAAKDLKVKLGLSGTAKNGRDYAKLPTTVVITAGQTQAVLRVSPIDDGITEQVENVLATLKANKAYTIDAGQADATIAIADATYLAEDFFPLPDGARWDYRLVGNPQVPLSYFTATTTPQGSEWTRWDYEDGQWALPVRSVFQSDDEGIFQVVDDDQKDGDIEIYDPARLWLPAQMAIGANYEIDAAFTGNDTGTKKGTISIVGIETIKVPAGTFRTLKVVVRDAETGSDWQDRETATLWLARGIGLVKFTSTGTSTSWGEDSGRDTWKFNAQLTSYSIDSPWQSKAAMSTVRDQFTGGLIEGQVYVFGGNGVDDENLKSAETFNPLANAWSPLADNHSYDGQGVEEITGAVLGGKLYVIGGWGFGADGLHKTFDSVQEYDPQTDTWTSKATKPTPVAAAPCAVFGGEIYVFGGYYAYEDAKGKEHLTQYNVVEAYNPATNTWRQVTRMPKKFSEFALAVVGQTAYLMGGHVSNSLSTATVSYDFVTGLWKTKGLAPMPQTRLVSQHGAAVPVVDGKIYVIGGIVGTVKSHWGTNRVDIYDPATNTWTVGPALPKPVGQGLALAADGTLYVLGGQPFPGLEDDSKFTTAEVWALPLD